MNLQELSKAVDQLDRCQQLISKLKIFDHDTADEACPGMERIRTDVTVQIGGPSAHITFTVLTRQEHTIIKEAITNLLERRRKFYKSEFVDLCADVVKDEVNEDKETKNE